MSSNNPYEPPRSIIAAEASTDRLYRKSITKRFLQTMLGSLISGIIGFGAGIFSANLYADHYYPNDPDPVDFTIGAIMLWAWAGAWAVGTALSAWLAFRRSAASGD